MRKICKMPSPEFLIAGQDNGDEMEFDDDEEMTCDEWIVVDAAPKKILFDTNEM